MPSDLAHQQLHVLKKVVSSKVSQFKTNVLVRFLLISNKLRLIVGVVQGDTEDFASHEDLYEALGGLLSEADPEKTEEDIQNICERLYHVMKG